MNYLDILRKRKSGEKTPTITKYRLSREQKELARQGICTKCGEKKAAKTSYICGDCQSDDTFEDIQKDIEALRRRLLRKSGEQV